MREGSSPRFAYASAALIDRTPFKPLLLLLLAVDVLLDPSAGFTSSVSSTVWMVVNILDAGEGRGRPVSQKSLHGRGGYKKQTLLEEQQQ